MKNYSEQQISKMRNALRNLIVKLPAIAHEAGAHNFNELINNDDILNDVFIKQATGITREQIAQLFKNKDTYMLDMLIAETWKK